MSSPRITVDRAATTSVELVVAVHAHTVNNAPKHTAMIEAARISGRRRIRGGPGRSIGDIGDPGRLDFGRHPVGTFIILTYPR
jgi:hypothetical protein